MLRAVYRASQEHGAVLHNADRQPGDFPFWRFVFDFLWPTLGAQPCKWWASPVEAMPGIWSVCHSSNVGVELLSILLTAPVICAPTPPPHTHTHTYTLCLLLPCHSCLEHIPETRKDIMCTSTALLHSYVQIKMQSLCCLAVIIVAHSVIAEQWKVWIEPWRGDIEILSSFLHFICCSVDCCRGCISLAAHGAESKPCKQTLMRMCTSLWISAVSFVV